MPTSQYDQYLSKYHLYLAVTEEGKPFYPPVGTVEHLNGDNAGYDLKVVKDVIPTTVATLIPLGVKAELVYLNTDGDGDGNVHYSLEPRSSIYKTGFMMANGRGVIDKTYRGQLMAPVISVGTNLKTVEAGTRLFQIVAPDMGYIKSVSYVDESMLSTTARGTGGFGSTGTK
jgi:deoxyuridine 5'-triphosphate nucleotidohydrolase